MKTGQYCSMSLLYLELGVFPVRFQIQIIMLNFLQYILKQDANSLIQKFFRARIQQKNYWVSHMKTISIDTGISLSFEDVGKSWKLFKKTVDIQVKSAGVKYLV